jgi:hypothetical protein
MEACSTGRVVQLPNYLGQIVTPLKLERWQELLSGHPDQEFTAYILRGIRDGFRVGFNAAGTRLKSQKSNMLSASEHPDIVSKYLQEEIACGRVIKVQAGQEAELLGIHCSPFGVIPKKRKANKWRLILDLSSPDQHSTNDGIDKDLASLPYMSVDEVIAVALQLGKRALLAKMDIKQAYRNVLIHPHDRPLLGMCWEGTVYVDAALPFGLRTAPLIFSALADTLQWIMQKKGVGCIYR